ncbi:hypothetical protein [Streptomyces sp. SLBN-118]|uniref:hypothetical protein n=1 Tax=Streptomyces sp. SLBN-118 TaxID=2768454 RepID=UPI00114EEF78|nr:hypothetical protein [Streptomyces sp. SLBN-118]
MTGTTRAPVDVLEFSDDLVEADVQPLRDFLTARLTELIERQPPGSDERFAVAALMDHVTLDCIGLSDGLLAWGGHVARGQKNQAGHVQTLRQDIRSRWNLLCRTAACWREHPEHQSRWRELYHLCAEHAEFVEQTMGDASSGPYEVRAHP